MFKNKVIVPFSQAKKLQLERKWSTLLFLTAYSLGHQVAYIVWYLFSLYYLQLTPEFSQRLNNKIRELLQQMERGLKSADPRDSTVYTGWAGMKCWLGAGTSIGEESCLAEWYTLKCFLHLHRRNCFWRECYALSLTWYLLDL